MSDAFKMVHGMAGTSGPIRRAARAAWRIMTSNGSEASRASSVIRTLDEEIRWMNMTEYLQKQGKKTRQIVFEEEPFTALSLMKLRDEVLSA